MMSKIVIISALLACVSSGPLDAGYGIPVAPLIVSPQLLQPQTLHSAPIPLGSSPFGLPLTNSLPLNSAFPLAASPGPVPFAAAPFPTTGAAFPFASAPLSFGPAPLPLGAAPLTQSAAPLPLGPAPFQPFAAPLPLSAAPLPFAGAPLSVGPAPLAQVLPSVPSSQFHAQDEFGQFSFGYENINSKKTETKDAFGVTRGSYEYVDANGALQIVNYVADPVNGFRVAGTNIPVAPVAPQIPVHAPLIAPEPVMETPEVKAARAEHLAAHEKLAKAVAVSERKKRSTDYKVPAAPVLVHVATPAPILVNSVPAPFINQAFAHPIAPLPLSAFPGPIGSSGPFPLPAGHSPLPFAQAPLPLAAAFNPFPVANANAPFPVGASPLNFGAAPFVGAPLSVGHAALPLTSAPLSFAGAPLALSGAPLPFSGAPFSAAPAPLAPVPNFVPSSQFHAQDEFGQFSFGYENINSKKTETKDAFGVTRGSYEYVDANGALQIVNYVADPVNGFRVAGTNIPVAPAALNAALPVAPQVPVHAPLIAPEPVMDTPEVKAARAEHLAAHEKLAANAKKETLKKEDETTKAEEL